MLRQEAEAEEAAVERAVPQEVRQREAAGGGAEPEQSSCQTSANPSATTQRIGTTSTSRRTQTVIVSGRTKAAGAAALPMKHSERSDRLDCMLAGQAKCASVTCRTKT